MESMMAIRARLGATSLSHLPRILVSENILGELGFLLVFPTVLKPVLLASPKRSPIKPPPIYMRWTTITEAFAYAAAQLPTISKVLRCTHLIQSKKIL